MPSFKNKLKWYAELELSSFLITVGNIKLSAHVPFFSFQTL